MKGVATLTREAMLTDDDSDASATCRGTLICYYLDVGARLSVAK